MRLEEALGLLYRGRANVAKQAKNLGMSTAELQERFRAYVSQVPFERTDWEKSEELCWPYIT